VVHRIGEQDVVWAWDVDVEPAAWVDPGDTVIVQTQDPSGGQITITSSADDVARLDLRRVNAISRPIAIRGAEPGDAVAVEILGITCCDWGWTASIPGFGLLADQFPEPRLIVSSIHTDSRGAFIEGFPHVRLPVRPMIGTLGLVPAGAHGESLIPPHDHGGNMDVPDLTTGSRLLLPVGVPGGLLSLGDVHACQGHGEVCGTAVETSAEVTVRVDLLKSARLGRPRLVAARDREQAPPGWIFFGIDTDLMSAARAAVLDAIDWLATERNLAPWEAYLLCSVVGDLVITEIVDRPRWVVNLHVPETIFLA
jgi:acetamidase/formamidase